MKRTLLFLMALIMSAGFAFAQTILPSSNDVPGVKIYNTATGNQFSGVNIVLGNDADVWPWATAADDGLVAFTPEKGETYHMTFNTTSTGAAGFRVRWFKDATAYDSPTANDTEDVNKNVYTADQTAVLVPAYFQGTIANGETKTYSVDFTMDGNQPSNGLVGNLVIRGQQGSQDFVINTIVITDSKGNMLVNYDKGATTSIIKVKTAITNVYNTNGGIIVNGNNENVSVYTIDGRLVKQTIARQSTIIPLQQGLHVVKVGANKAVKVMVK